MRAILIPILIIFFYILTLLQASFFVHFDFNIWGFFPNFVLLAVIILNIFQSPQKNSGLLIAFLAGFFLDIFSENFLGFYILISLALAIFIKFIFKKHIRLVILSRPKL